ncbi:MAG TPA: DEAD/DEAH box helicase [Longimicrobiales bacterium]
MSNDRRAKAPAPPGRGATDFASLNLRPELLRAITELGFTRPTPVQAAAIPAALDGRDVLACAATGSGKTAAFLLPILQRLHGKPRGVTRALILTPTRELAAQVDENRAELARHTRLTGAAVFGGVGMGPQEAAFRRGVDILVATPGRLLDHFQHDYARLDGVEVLVLDEADRMLDMGFLPAIRRVLRHLPAGPRQTMLFSATMPEPIVKLSRDLLRDPARIDVERRQAPAATITQALYPVPQTAKVALLVELLRRGDVGNAIVFCRTKHRANRVAQKLEKQGIAAARIHGNRSQKQRTEALAGFKEGRYRVLVATDIVARGIDVEALDHVVNFDLPAATEDYIHRVGRTGRAEATGDAISFVAPDEEDQVRAIERALGRRIERRTLPDFDYHARESEPLEIPLAERIAAIRAQRAVERERAKAKAERRARAEAEKANAANGRAGKAQKAQAGKEPAAGGAPSRERAGPGAQAAGGTHAGGRPGQPPHAGARPDGAGAGAGRSRRRRRRRGRGGNSR